MFRKELRLQWIFFVVKPIWKSRSPSLPSPKGPEVLPAASSFTGMAGIQSISLSNSLHFIANHEAFLNMFVQSTN